MNSEIRGRPSTNCHICNGYEIDKRRGISLLIVALALGSILLALAILSQQAGAQEIPEIPADLGDAPDSLFNHYGINNTAYFATLIPGRFPTVFRGTPPGEAPGPIHWQADQAWLGEKVSFEEEADILPDQDVYNNILDQGNDNADQDRYDDGWLNPDVKFTPCGTTTLKVRISAVPNLGVEELFLNVWYDGNRDGDWEDLSDCTGAVGHEWIVQNYAIPAALLGGGMVDIDVPTVLVAEDPTLELMPYWIRFTLSEKPAPPPVQGGLPEGGGPEEGFELGETEDYLIKPEVPPIDIEKHVYPPAIQAGDALTYTIILLPPLEMVGQTVFVSDTIPVEAIVFTDSFSVSTGDLNYDAQKRQIMWYVPIDDTGITPTLHARLGTHIDFPPCWERPPIRNRAYLRPDMAGDIVIASNEVRTDWLCSDLGDAPDSIDNHHGISNTAYSAPVVMGRFPTVWRSRPGNPSGPKHQDATQIWLGEMVSYEVEADIGIDQDPTNNILDKGVDIADLDLHDDGWMNPNMGFNDCQSTTLDVMITAAPTGYLPDIIYLNVWYDGNHDGDWDDTRTCADGQKIAHEWIVQDFQVVPASINGSLIFPVPTTLILNTDPAQEGWIRFSLSEQPAPQIAGAAALADGRGPDYPMHYELGETEDYLVPGREPPDIDIDKVTDLEAVPPGGIIPYTITIVNNGTIPAAGVLVTDAIPMGTMLLTPTLKASTGQVMYHADENVIHWTLDITNDTLTETLNYNVKVWDDERLDCEMLIWNRAYLYPFLDIPPLIADVRTPLICSDLGDAPDSTYNHHSIMTNTAYLTPTIKGRYPTVWAGTPNTAPSGPLHKDATWVWLGKHVSFEMEADIGPDQDIRNNILNGGKDNADNDQFDDGWLNPKAVFPDCKETTLKVRISRRPGVQTGRMFLNVWFDGNRDGDWDDVRRCANQTSYGHEWIVQDFIVDTSTIVGYQDIVVPTTLILNADPDAPAWVRFTLSEKPAQRPPTGGLADGRGPAYTDAFQWGETEDYSYRPLPSGEPGTVEITKTVSTNVVKVGEIFTYTIELAHKGGTAAMYTMMTDTLPSELTLVNGPYVTEVISSVTPLIANFDGQHITWKGYLSPGARIRIDFQVKARYCPLTAAAKAINNIAKAIDPDGNEVKSGVEITLDCTPPPPPELDLEKHIVFENGEEEQSLALVIPGQKVWYKLTLENNDTISHTVHLSDSLPTGLWGVSVRATRGKALLLHGGQAVAWDGDIGPDETVEIWIEVQLNREVDCDARLINQAFWHTEIYDGESNIVILEVICHDLGDAPDSTNHYTPTRMTAYPGVQANYPTVFNVSAPQRGPKHLLPQPFHLGPRVSVEVEADIGPDIDGVNNIVPPKNAADLDKADDGLNLLKLSFTDCQPTRFPVTISIDPYIAHALTETDGIARLNVWLDSNRDGDWADFVQCGQQEALEHIVIDYPVDVGKLGVGLHTIMVSTSGPVSWPDDMIDDPSWLRLTLSVRLSNKTLTSSGGIQYGDGRGHQMAFWVGETEDYIYRDPQQPGGDSDPMVEKQGWIYPQLDTLTHMSRAVWHLGWMVEYRNPGPAASNNVKIVDSYTPGIVDVKDFAIPPLSSSTSGNTITYDVGKLNPGESGVIFIHGRVPMTTAAGTVFTNSVTITGTGDITISNNYAIAPLRVPLLPPRIVYPRPGTVCTGTFTVTGRVQTGLWVDLYIDGKLEGTVIPNAQGRWEHPVNLPDGKYAIYAIARTPATATIPNLTSPQSPLVIVIVDSSLTWNPLSLRFVDQMGYALFPRDVNGRMDERGWHVFLRPAMTYTVGVRACCSDPNTKVSMDIPGYGQLDLADPDGDHVFTGTFTTPPHRPVIGKMKICVTCYLIQHCSDGVVLIDPEGTTFDLIQGSAIAGATVACYESQAGESETYYNLWNAEDYEQTNPQTTGGDGYFSFFTPAGTYRLGVTKTGYQSYESWDLVVSDEPVHYDVPLAPELNTTPDYTVTISASGFEPAILQVEPGAVIEWINTNGEKHTTTSITPTVIYSPTTGVTIRALGSEDGWDSGLLEASGSYHRQLDAEGTYTYYDHENPLYTGIVIVGEAEIPEKYNIYLPLVLRQSS